MKRTVNFPKGGGSEIAQLCDKYGSDKGTATSEVKFSGGWDFHDYPPIYEIMFSPIRDSVKAILELGLGTNNPNVPSSMGIYGKPGASLRVWRDYFPEASVIGADIDTNILFSEDRIKTFYCDQTDPVSIAEFNKVCPINEFDIIIDDGLHTEEAAQIFFENAFSWLSTNGLYFIEDAWWWNGENIPFLDKEDTPYVVFGDSRHNSLIMIMKR